MFLFLMVACVKVISLFAAADTPFLFLLLLLLRLLVFGLVATAARVGEKIAAEDPVVLLLDLQAASKCPY